MPKRPAPKIHCIHNILANRFGLSKLTKVAMSSKFAPNHWFLVTFRHNFSKFSRMLDICPLWWHLIWDKRLSGKAVSTGWSKKTVFTSVVPLFSLSLALLLCLSACGGWVRTGKSKFTTTHSPFLHREIVVFIVLTVIIRVGMVVNKDWLMHRLHCLLSINSTCTC